MFRLAEELYLAVESIVMKYLIWALTLFFLSSCAEDREHILVETSDLTHSVYASCTVKAEGQYEINSSVSGKVLRIFTDEGMRVDSGQVILTIENTNPRLNAENAKLALDLARDNYRGSTSILKNLSLQRELAKDKLKDDSLNYSRQRSLWDQKIGSQVELEKKELAYYSSRNQFDLLDVQYRQAENQARTALRQAENNYEISLESSDEFEIRSDLKGKIYSLSKEQGENVRLQELLAIVGKGEEFYLELEIDQEDIMQIELGQEVFISLDAFNERVVQGKIRKIYPLINPSTQSFIAEAGLSDTSLKLFPGLTGEANVLVGKRQDVISIPVAYLIDDSLVELADKSWIPVKTGMRSLNKIEIAEGLSTGQKIYKPAQE